MDTCSTPGRAGPGALSTASTVQPNAASLRAVDFPMRPNPTMPTTRSRKRSSRAFAGSHRSALVSRSRAATPRKWASKSARA